MSIEIKITDPANTPAADIQLVITLLSRFAGGQAPAIPATIGYADLPTTGSPTPLEAFGGSAPSPEEAFGHANPTPEQAFGGAPLVPGLAAPYTAAAAPASIAQGAPMYTSSASAPAPGMAAPAPGSLAPTAAAPAPQTAPAPGVVVDRDGFPWDARIHAKAATGGGVANSDGTWRAKRGVDASFKAQVEAQLRGVMAAPAAPVPNAAAQAAVAQALAAAQAAANGHASSNAYPAAPAGVNPAYAPSAPLPATSNYVELVNQISAAMGAGKLTADDVRNCCAVYGIPDLPLLASRLDLVASVSTSINAVLATRG